MLLVRLFDWIKADVNQAERGSGGRFQSVGVFALWRMELRCREPLSLSLSLSPSLSLFLSHTHSYTHIRLRSVVVFQDYSTAYQHLMSILLNLEFYIYFIRTFKPSSVDMLTFKTFYKRLHNYSLFCIIIKLYKRETNHTFRVTI